MRGSTTNWTRSCAGTSRSRGRLKRKHRRRGPRAVDMAGITVAAMSCCETGPCSSRTWDMLRRAGGRGRRRARRASSESPAVPGIAGARDVRTRAYAQADPVEGRHAPHLAGPTDDGLRPGGGGLGGGARPRTPRAGQNLALAVLLVCDVVLPLGTCGGAASVARARRSRGAIRAPSRAPPDGARRASGRRAVAEDGRHELVDARVLEACGRGPGVGARAARRGRTEEAWTPRGGRGGRRARHAARDARARRFRRFLKFKRTRRVRAAVAEPHHLRDVGGGRPEALCLSSNFARTVA